ncbi:helix-turn-helix domain-containing protein [Flavobacteriaceae bacterium S356]|uniref:Helix-turn-helix domain-containing protein n=1 Tax=Asprobacillus argus TaxID=3076534 RepID=A0ABU3LDV8_9FLAO|nr:helix-turn-helix domain-containing protein [Flavobacteriaceae bacterium S356]
MSLLPAFVFPNFNIHSTPLLILVLQGLIFVGLLLVKYAKNKNPSDLLLALILLLVCYQQTCYTVGFMGWYDTFRNTKINYWLMPIALALGPMIYIYVRSVTTSVFRFTRKDLRHFILAIALVIYRVSIYTYDTLQTGFDATQNGVLKLALDEPIVLPILNFLNFAVMLLYLAFTFQLFYNYRNKIQQYFSNTYKLELNWILSFLVVFTALFLYGTIQTLINEYVTELSYKQQWWLNLFMAIITIYVGIRGYFTDTTKLKRLNFTFTPNPISIPQVEKDKGVSQEEIDHVRTYMEKEKPYLNPELNLSDLATALDMSRAQLSQVINNGFNKNFNDFVNSFRIDTFKEKLKEGKHKQLSLLGIAYDSGFNSKATFNRVFKKLTSTSPTEYLNSHIQ